MANSTIPGLANLPKKKIMKTSWNYLEARKKIDGAEGLWRIGNNLYDLSKFAKSHPGGAEWIQLTKGTDITELFETHHITDKANELLPKFYVREATTPRTIPLTFQPNGFYRTFKKRAAEALKTVNFHHSSLTSNFITDFLVLTTFLLTASSAVYQSYTIIIFAGIFLTWTTIAGHNYIHQKNSFRMYYFDLSLLSSKDWRISHAMSHHMYPNTLWDYEMYAFEPFFQWYLYKDKSYFWGVISKFLTILIWPMLFFIEGIKRYYSAFREYRVIEFRDLVPLILPLLISLLAPKIFVALKLWIVLMIVGSSIFSLIGFNAAHHHPDIFHDGDIYRDDMDWGLLELDTVRDREIIDDSTFLALTSFGSHTLHHLLPTVDHHYLSLCVPAFLETCKEFKVSSDKLTQWELLKGQYNQLTRLEPKKNRR